MAELILTDEEKAARSWLDLDDASLGRLVKRTALKIIEHDEADRQRVWTMTAAIILMGAAQDTNADNLKISLGGLTQKGQAVGDWEVIVRKAGTP